MARRRDDDDDDDYDDDDDDRKRRRDDDDDDDDDDDRPRRKGAKKGGKKGAGVPIGEYLFFRQLIGPPLVTTIFFLGVLFCLWMCYDNISKLFIDLWPTKTQSTIMGVCWLLAGPIAVRGFCECLSCLLRIAESLDALKKSAEEQAKRRDEDDDDDDYDDDDEED